LSAGSARAEEIANVARIAKNRITTLNADDRGSGKKTFSPRRRGDAEKRQRQKSTTEARRHVERQKSEIGKAKPKLPRIDADDRGSGKTIFHRGGAETRRKSKKLPLRHGERHGKIAEIAEIAEIARDRKSKGKKPKLPRIDADDRGLRGIV
jgi:hypothetical protein